MIRAIIFDYGNVIARFDHMLFFRRIAPFSSLSEVELMEAVRAAPNLIVEYESGRLTSREFFEHARERLRLSITEEEFHAVFVNIFERIPSTIALVSRLKPAYKLGLLSNTNEWHFQAEMATLEIFPLFDAVTLSFEVGAMKPAERIYEDAMRKLCCEPNECVYIDDIAEYVEKAKQLGMFGIHYVSHQALMASLQALQISTD